MKRGHKVTNTFHNRVMPHGRTTKCCSMTQVLSYKSRGKWGPELSWILSFLLCQTRFCSKFPWLTLGTFFPQAQMLVATIFELRKLLKAQTQGLLRILLSPRWPRIKQSPKKRLSPVASRKHFVKDKVLPRVLCFQKKIVSLDQVFSFKYNSLPK